MDIDNFIVYIKTEDICVDITKDSEMIFHTSNYDWPLLKGKNKNLIGLMKDGLVEKIIAEFPALKLKTTAV